MEDLIRSFGLRDAFTVRDLERRGAVLDLESSLLDRHMSLRLAITAYFLPHVARAHTCILESGVGSTRERGFIQLRGKSGRPEWVILCLAPALSEGSRAAAIWHQLVAGVLPLASEEGILRVYANPMKDDATEQALGQEGFSVYARETILRFETQPAAVPEPVDAWRRAQDRDWWPLGSLYRSVTPHLICQAEDRYGGGERGFSPGWADSLDEEGYVLEQGGDLIAYVSLRRGSKGAWVCMLVSEDDRPVSEVVSDAVRLVVGRTSQPLYWAVRTYQGKVERALCAGGFESIGERSLMVRHTASRVVVGNRQFVPGLDKGVHARPRLAPSSERASRADSVDPVELRSIN